MNIIARFSWLRKEYISTVLKVYWSLLERIQKKFCHYSIYWFPRDRSEFWVNCYFTSWIRLGLYINLDSSQEWHKRKPELSQTSFAPIFCLATPTLKYRIEYTSVCEGVHKIWHYLLLEFKVGSKWLLVSPKGYENCYRVLSLSIKVCVRLSCDVIINQPVQLLI